MVGVFLPRYYSIGEVKIEYLGFIADREGVSYRVKIPAGVSSAGRETGGIICHEETQSLLLDRSDHPSMEVVPQVAGIHAILDHDIEVFIKYLVRPGKVEAKLSEGLLPHGPFMAGNWIPIDPRIPYPQRGRVVWTKPGLAYVQQPYYAIFICSGLGFSQDRIWE